jgi:hypothetical protein
MPLIASIMSRTPTVCSPRHLPSAHTVSGDHRSAPSSVAAVTTLTPPLSEARLEGTWTVDSNVTQSDEGTPKVGYTETSSWQFTPKCTAGPCDVALSGDYFAEPFTATLTRAGAVYTGTTNASLTTCGPSNVPEQDTVKIQITVNNAGVANQIWSATSWIGTIQVFSPHTDLGGGNYCDAQSFIAHLSASP